MADDFPSHFLVKFYHQDRAYFTICEAVVSFNEGKLGELGLNSETVVKALDANQAKYSRGDDKPTVLILPNPGDECGPYTLFSAKLQTGKIQTSKEDGGTG